MAQGDEDRKDGAPVGPRIYNLFPLIAGPIESWNGHLDRIARMGFDWLYVNSFREAGESASLYAVKDPSRLDHRFRGCSERPDDELVADFIASAARHGLRTMTDLTIATLARDSPLVRQHPSWVAARPGASLEWPDVVLLAYDRSDARAALIDLWTRHIEHQVALGFRGFVCKMAALVPAEVWLALLSAARARDTAVMFVADTLGASPEQTEALAAPRFDYILNSARWWDFHAPWLLDQRRRLRHVAPSIAFPESHDSGRIAAPEADATGRRERSEFALLFSAFFSSGWMMPIGAEYGFRIPLDAARTTPADWEELAFDLTDFVAALNATRCTSPVLNTEGAVHSIAAPHGVVALLRLSSGTILSSPTAVLLLINPDPARARRLAVADIYPELGGRFQRFIDITPQRTPLDLRPGTNLTLEPLEIRAFRCDVAERPGAPSRTHTKPPPADGRVIIETVRPQIDCGRHPAKRIVGDNIEVSADIFVDGHDHIAACVKHRAIDDSAWQETRMVPLGNDRWQAHVPLLRNTTYLYTVEAWRDGYESWRAEYLKRREAGQNLDLPRREGLGLVRTTVTRRPGDAPRSLLPAALDAVVGEAAETLLLSEGTREFMRHFGEREFLTRYSRELAVIADRLAARYSAWYELFPRSLSGDRHRHGTFDDVIRHLPYIRDLGFDVLYFPPIHPIGRTNRKGRNNSLIARLGDPGSPYAIGSEAGGHDAVHPELGTIEDFHRLVATAHNHGLEIALDIAVQCSLDHPWLREHPEWFNRRPDGTIKHAENPPKKYEDIVNPNLYGAGYPGVWHAVRDIVRFWIDHGVAIFRIDNPHTKPVPFWEWLIGDIRQDHPEVIFLSEAFTRPKMMRKLAKAGFTQSYTYFTWRNTKAELIEYLTELCQGESSDYFRPNFFTNTPDINPPILQNGGRPAFMMRAVLAATLSSAYGIYSGFELCEGTPLPGREEYLDSEKYEIRSWDWNRPGNIRDYVAQLNAIRRNNPALHDFRNLKFYHADDDHVLVYGKMTAARDNFILAAVNLDPHNVRESNFELPLWEFDLPDWAGLHVEDLLGGGVMWWQGKIQRVRLDPVLGPAAIWRLTRPGSEHAGDGGMA